MSSANKVILLGRIGKDPEVKYFSSGDAYCNLSIATTEKWKDKQSGERKEKTDWHNLSFRKKLAEIVGQYVSKGDLLYVEGKLSNRQWEKDGQKHYATEVVVEQMQLLGGKKDDATPQQRARNEPPKASAAEKPFEDDSLDDLPF